MATSMAHSLTLPSVGASPVGQLHGGAQSKRRSAARAALAGRRNVLAKSASLSITPFQSFSGMRKASAIDSLTVEQGKDFKSVVANSTAVSKRSGASRAVPTALFERFTEKAIKVIMLAQEEARPLGHNFVSTEQILLGLIGEGTGIAAKVLKSMGVNLKEAREEVEKIIGRGSGFVPAEIPFTPRAKRVLEIYTLEEARKFGHNYIGTEHLLLGLLREGEGVAAQVLENLGADPSIIRTQVIRMVDGSSGNEMPTLEEYWTNLTKRAKEGKLGPVVGRVAQNERVTHILGRRAQINSCLIGEPGVGKTAFAEGLAQRFASRDLPETMGGSKVITLNMGLWVAETKYREEFEERLKKLTKQADDIVVVINEVHTLFGAAEGAIDPTKHLEARFGSW